MTCCSSRSQAPAVTALWEQDGHLLETWAKGDSPKRPIAGSAPCFAFVYDPSGGKDKKANSSSDAVTVHLSSVAGYGRSRFMISLCCSNGKAALERENNQTRSMISSIYLDRLSRLFQPYIVEVLMSFWWCGCDEHLWFLQTCSEMSVCLHTDSKCQENVSIETEIFVVNMQICQ